MNDQAKDDYQRGVRDCKQGRLIDLDASVDYQNGYGAEYESGMRDDNETVKQGIKMGVEL
jgi:hypothetical protein